MERFVGWRICRLECLLIDKLNHPLLDGTYSTNGLNIGTSASNKRFKSCSIYILSSTLNQTRCIQFINTLKLITTTASDIN